jgi:site-specific DNA-cytosine methylase
MGFDDSDFEAAVWSGSNTDVKLYKQAGNSIAVPVVQAILSVLLGVKS